MKGLHAPRVGTLVQILLPFLVAFCILYWVFHRIDFGEFFTKIQQVNSYLVILTLPMYLIANLFRSYRWNLLFGSIGIPPSLAKSTVALFSGYLVNLAIPRLGEVTRCVVLGRMSPLKFSTSLGTVIAERVVDVATLLILTLVLVLGRASLLEDLFREMTRDASLAYLYSGRGLLLLGIGVLVLGGVIYLLVKRFWKAGKRSFLKNLKEGIFSIRSMKYPVRFVASTLLHWISFYLLTYLLTLSFEASSSLGPFEIFIIVVVGGISVSMPVQGGIGVFHVAVSYTLMTFGLESTEALFLATLMHLSGFINTLILGSGALVLVPFLARNTHGKNSG